MYLGTRAKMSSTHLFYSLLISECISEENDKLVILEESMALDQDTVHKKTKVWCFSETTKKSIKV